jgi:hypothetical protein
VGDLGAYLAAIEGDGIARSINIMAYQWTPRGARATVFGAYTLADGMSGLKGGPEPTRIDYRQRHRSGKVDSFGDRRRDITALQIGGRIANGGRLAAGCCRLLRTVMDVNGTLTANATIAKRLYTLGTSSKFVRPGSVRVGVRFDCGLSLSERPQGDNPEVVLVAINANRVDAELTAARARRSATIARGAVGDLGHG